MLGRIGSVLRQKRFNRMWAFVFDRMFPSCDHLCGTSRNNYCGVFGFAYRFAVCVRVCVVVEQSGEETFFKVKSSTKMGKVFGAYAKRKGVEATAMRFIYDGGRVGNDDTPQSVSLVRILSLGWCRGTVA